MNKKSVRKDRVWKGKEKIEANQRMTEKKKKEKRSGAYTTTTRVYIYIKEWHSLAPSRGLLASSERRCSTRRTTRRGRRARRGRSWHRWRRRNHDSRRRLPRERARHRRFGMPNMIRRWRRGWVDTRPAVRASSRRTLMLTVHNGYIIAVGRRRWHGSADRQLSNSD